MSQPAQHIVYLYYVEAAVLIYTMIFATPRTARLAAEEPAEAGTNEQTRGGDRLAPAKRKATDCRSELATRSTQS